VIELVRATRSHPEIRVGSSVRGAIDMLLLAHELADLRDAEPSSRGVALDAALTALTGRVRLHDSSPSNPEAIITELFDRIMSSAGAETDASQQPGGDPGKAQAPAGAAPR